MQQVNAAARLDRLAMGPFHWRVLRLIGLGMFFDSFDTSMMAGILGALVQGKFSTLAENANFISATFVGVSIGAALAGFLGDRYGRRFAYQFNLAIFGVMSLIAALAPSMSWLIPIRGIMGVGLGAEFVVGYGMLTEFVPPASRGRAIGIVSLISSSGVFVVSLVNTIVIPNFGWRAMFVIGGVGALWVWFLRRKLPESPRWLESTGRLAEAEAVITEIEAESVQGPALPEAIAPVAPQPAGGFLQLFRPPLLRRTLLGMAVNVVCLVGAYSFIQWLPSFLIQGGLSVERSLALHTAMTAGTIAGPLLCIVVSDRVGRRWGIAACGVVCCVLGLLYPHMHDPVPMVACGFVLVTFMSLFLSLGLGTYTPELFPTDCRMRGSGISQLVGRVSLIAAPFVVLALYRNYGITGVVVTVALMYLALAAGVAGFGVETRGRSLEGIAGEALVTSTEPARRFSRTTS